MSLKAYSGSSAKVVCAFPPEEVATQLHASSLPTVPGLCTAGLNFAFPGQRRDSTHSGHDSDAADWFHVFRFKLAPIQTISRA